MLASTASVCWFKTEATVWIKVLKFIELTGSNVLAVTNLAICINLSFIVSVRAVKGCSKCTIYTSNQPQNKCFRLSGCEANAMPSYVEEEFLFQRNRWFHPSRSARPRLVFRFTTSSPLTVRAFSVWTQSYALPLAVGVGCSPQCSYDRPTVSIHLDTHGNESALWARLHTLYLFSPTRPFKCLAVASRLSEASKHDSSAGHDLTGHVCDAALLRSCSGRGGAVLGEHARNQDVVLGIECQSGMPEATIRGNTCHAVYSRSVCVLCIAHHASRRNSVVLHVASIFCLNENRYVLAVLAIA